MLDKQITGLDVEIARRSREDEVTRRLMTIPGVGPITASATTALPPRIETFHKGQDFALWLGLTPLPRLDQPRMVTAHIMRSRPACRGDID